MENRMIVESFDNPRADCAAIYYWFWVCCRITGIDIGYGKYFYRFYDLFLNVFVTIAYPLHLIVGLFLSPTLADVFKNLSIGVTCFNCSIKHYILRYKMKQIKIMEEKLCQLDQKIVEEDERKFFNNVPRVQSLRIMQLFLTASACADISSFSAALLSSERRVMYPAWFPFDFTSTALLYGLALGYQFFGVSMQIVQNMANDSYTPISLCVVGGHFRLLGMRVAKIGYNSKKTEEEHRQDLISCIRDHKMLIDVLQILQNTIYFGQFVQFLSSGLIACVTLIYLLFYADSFFAYVYYAVYIFCMGIEIFPCCYYGSLLEEELENLPHAIFSSNWMMRTPKFRKELIIFMQLTLKSFKLTAGGFIGINIDAFFGSCKMAYSMFAVVLRTRQYRN